jgi:hypothetical protein
MSQFKRTNATLLKVMGLATSAALAFIPFNSPASAQSVNRDYPTPLTSNVVSGMGTLGQNQTYYYRFIAVPGELVLTLDADAGSTNGNGVVPEVSIQDGDGNEIGSVNAYATPGMPKRSVKRINFMAPTPVVMQVNLPGGSTANYMYRIRLEGAVQPMRP